VARLATVITSPAGAIAAKAQSRAVGLNVSKTLAVVALLSFGGARKGATIGLVARLLACVPSVRRVDIARLGGEASYSCSRGARLKSKLQRSGQRCHTYSKPDEREKTFW
jgi:hypothetical protein